MYKQSVKGYLPLELNQDARDHLNIPWLWNF